MFRESYNGDDKKILWQEIWRDEFEAALENDPSSVGDLSKYSSG